mgnify:CR=1 FL=1
METKGAITHQLDNVYTFMEDFGFPEEFITTSKRNRLTKAKDENYVYIISVGIFHIEKVKYTHEEYYLSVGVGTHKLLFRFLEKTIVSSFEVNFYPEEFGFANVREFYDKFHCIQTYLEITGQG